MRATRGGSWGKLGTSDGGSLSLSMNPVAFTRSGEYCQRAAIAFISSPRAFWMVERAVDSGMKEWNLSASASSTSDAIVKHKHEQCFHRKLTFVQEYFQKEYFLSKYTNSDYILVLHLFWIILRVMHMLKQFIYNNNKILFALLNANAEFN